MEKIYDISGTYQPYGLGCFSDRNKLEGTIILNDNNWFEGVVRDAHHSLRSGSLVFGIYYPGKIISMFKIAADDVENPLTFHGRISSLAYTGTVSTLTDYSEISFGISHITMVENKNLIEQGSNLIERIDELKDMTSVSSIYDATYSVRDALSEMVLASYEGKKVPKKDVDSLLEKWFNVTTQSDDRVKKYVKVQTE